MILEGVVLGSRGFGREVLHLGHLLRLHFGLKSSKGINYGSTICRYISRTDELGFEVYPLPLVGNIPRTGGYKLKDMG